MEGKYEFVSPEWDDVSDSAKDLVSYMYQMLFLEAVACYLKLHCHVPNETSYAVFMARRR